VPIVLIMNVDALEQMSRPVRQGLALALPRFVSVTLVAAALLGAAPSQPVQPDATPQQLYGAVADPTCSNASPHCNTDATTNTVDPVLMTRITTSIDGYWQQAFSTHHARYTSPTIQWYVGAVEPVSTGCGVATAEPAFYCAKDRTIYLDSSLLVQAPFQAGDGDIAVAVSIAHEWTHHVQRLLGLRRSLTPSGPADFLPEYLELQADCGAGAWLWSLSSSHQSDAWDAPLAADFFGTIGDPISTPYAVNAHGTDPQRVAAFQAGLAGGRYAVDCQLPLN